MRDSHDFPIRMAFAAIKATQREIDNEAQRKYYPYAPHDLLIAHMTLRKVELNLARLYNQERFGHLEKEKG